MKRARLNRGDTLGDECRAAIDESRRLRAVGQSAPRNLVVIRLIRLPQIRGVGVGHGTFRAHPVQCSARVEAAGECNTNLLAYGEVLQDVRHERRL
jgi:hypothetical protein